METRDQSAFPANDPTAILRELQNMNGLTITDQVASAAIEHANAIAQRGGEVRRFMSAVVNVYLTVIRNGDTSLPPTIVDELALHF